MRLHCQKPSINHAAHSFCLFASVFCFPEPSHPPLSTQSSFGGLSHKQLHAQLTERLEQVLRERELQEQNPTEIVATEKEARPVKKPHRPTQTKPSTAEQSGKSKNSGTDITKNMVRNVQLVVMKPFSAQICGLIFLVYTKPF